MTVRYISVTLGTRDAGGGFSKATTKHVASQTSDVTVAWDDSVVTHKGDLIEGVRIALQTALGTLPA